MPRCWWQGQRGQGGLTPQSNEVSVTFGLRIHLQLFLQEINLLCLQVEPMQWWFFVTRIASTNGLVPGGNLRRWKYSPWPHMMKEVKTVKDQRTKVIPQNHMFRNSLASCCYQATSETPLVLPRLPPYLLCQHRRDRRDRHDATGLKGTSKSMLKFIVPVSGCHDIPFWNMGHP